MSVNGYNGNQQNGYNNMYPAQGNNQGQLTQQNNYPMEQQPMMNQGQPPVYGHPQQQQPQYGMQQPQPAQPYNPHTQVPPNTNVNTPYSAPQQQQQPQQVQGGQYASYEQQQYQQPQYQQQQQQPNNKLQANRPQPLALGPKLNDSAPSTPYGGMSTPNTRQLQQTPKPLQQYDEPQTPTDKYGMPLAKPQVRRGSLGGRVDRIDPKQIPRPVEAKVGSNIQTYYTRSGQAPPFAISEYQVVDEGNCSPRFIRMTTNTIARDGELMDSTKLCIGAIIQPLAELQPNEDPIEVVDTTQTDGPIRCETCKAYVNPFFKFIEAGKKYVCNICHSVNKCPDYYVCNLDANNLRRDRMERYELCRGSIEFNVGKDFQLRPMADPTYLFVIDVSHSAIATGLVDLAIDAVREALEVIGEKSEKAKAGIVTYNEFIQFYAFDPEKNDPQLMVMCDTDEPFVPIPAEQILVTVADEKSRYMLDAVLDMLPDIYNQETDAAAAQQADSEANVPRPKGSPPHVPHHKRNCAGAAAQAACMTLFGTGGKVIFTQAALPTVGAGCLQDREAGASGQSLYNTKQEKTLFVPQTSFYHALATQCAENAVTVDLFICANMYVDLATSGILSTKTGGQIYHYPGFSVSKDGNALTQDMLRNVSRTTGWDGVMIVRCTAGLRVAEQFGNYFHRRQLEMDLPTVDADKTFGVRFEHEGKLKEKTECCIQCALLYTTHDGQRRIRVHTLSLPVTNLMSNVFRYSDLDAIINLSLKQAVKQIFTSSTPQEAQTALTKACIDSLFVYRKYCASATSPGQLILPEPLKLLPLNTLGLIKHPIFQAGLSADDRAFMHSWITAMPVNVSVPFVSPRLYSLLDIPEKCCVSIEAQQQTAQELDFNENSMGRVFLPASLSLSNESMSGTGMYLLDNGRALYLFVPSGCDPQDIANVFGETSANRREVVNVSGDSLSTSGRILTLIDTLRSVKPTFQVLNVISSTMQSNGGSNIPSQQSLDEQLFYSFMIEDGVARRKSRSGVKTTEKLADKNPNEMSYIDFLCWLHKQIQNKFYN